MQPTLQEALLQLHAWDTWSAHREGHDPCSNLGGIGSGVPDCSHQQTGNQAICLSMSRAAGLPLFGSHGKGAPSNLSTNAQTTESLLPPMRWKVLTTEQFGVHHRTGLHCETATAGKEA